VRILVIGVGNDSSGADAAGLLAVRKLGRDDRTNVTYLEHDGDGTSLVEAWKGSSHVFIIDAVRSGSEPGSIHRWTDIEDQSVVHRASTHALGLADAWRLAKVLQVLPKSMVVYGIEGSDFQIGKPVSTTVKKGVDAVVKRLGEEVNDLITTEELRDA